MAKLQPQSTRISLPASIIRRVAYALLPLLLVAALVMAATAAEAHHRLGHAGGHPSWTREPAPLPPEEQLPPTGEQLPPSSSADFDGDGVPDSSDWCPARAGVSSNDGCPAGEAKPGTAGFTTGNTSTAAAANRQAFFNLSWTCRDVTLPPGQYYVDQSVSKPFIIVNDYCGTFTMLAGAEIHYVHPDGGGIKWSRGNAPKFFGWTSFHGATVRDGMDDNVGFFSTTDMVISGARISGGGSAGLLVWQTTRPTILHSYAEKTMADGIHIVATSNATVRDWSAYRTGDDGLSFQTYAEQYPQSSGTAENIKVIESGTRGITVLGSRDVTIRNFEVRNAWTSGLYVECTYHYNDCAAKPVANVLFENGKVYDAGRHPKGVGPNPDSITVWKASNNNIVFRDIESYSPVRDCFRAFDGGGATIINVRGDGAGCPAF